MDLQTRINNAISYTKVILDSGTKGNIATAYLNKIVSLLTDIRNQHYPSQAELYKEATAEDAEQIFDNETSS